MENGRMINKEYSYDFHQFVKFNVLYVSIVLPGINHNSLQINVKEDRLDILVKVQNGYYFLYQAKYVKLNGKLKSKVREKVYKSTYELGVLKIGLAMQ